MPSSAEWSHCAIDFNVRSRTSGFVRTMTTTDGQSVQWFLVHTFKTWVLCLLLFHYACCKIIESTLNNFPGESAVLECDWQDPMLLLLSCCRCPSNPARIVSFGWGPRSYPGVKVRQTSRHYLWHARGDTLCHLLRIPALCECRTHGSRVFRV